MEIIILQVCLHFMARNYFVHLPVKNAAHKFEAVFLFYQFSFLFFFLIYYNNIVTFFASVIFVTFFPIWNWVVHIIGLQDFSSKF